MSIVEGGHAIMLAVRLPEELDFGTSKPHVTLAFIGRNLKKCVGPRMRTAAFSAFHWVPEYVTFTGELALFGLRQDILVALIEPTEELIKLRTELLTHLWYFRLEASTIPYKEFRPHVTLGDSCMKEWPDVEGCEFSTLGLDIKIGSEIERIS